MLLAMTGCQKMAQNISDNASKLTMATSVRYMRSYPNDIQACDSILKAKGFQADKLTDLGTTTWTRANTGSVTRTKSVNDGCTTIYYKAETTYSSYNYVHARAWAYDAYECEGKNYYFKGTLDDKSFSTYDELYKMLENEPSIGFSVAYKYDSREGSFVILPATNGKCAFIFQHVDYMYK